VVAVTRNNDDGSAPILLPLSLVSNIRVPIDAGVVDESDGIERNTNTSVSPTGIELGVYYMTTRLIKRDEW
jgi:hypothetical protein